VAASQLRLLELVVVEVVVVVVDVVVVTDTGGGVDALLGEAVGRGLTVGDDVPEVVMLTSAQFQNCSGHPRPSGGIVSHILMPEPSPSG